MVWGLGFRAMGFYAIGVLRLGCWRGGVALRV